MKDKDISDEMKSYYKDFLEDQDVDELILMNKLENLSNIAHKWLSRHFKKKTELVDLKKHREDLYDTVFEEIKHKDDPQVRTLNATAFKRKIESTDVIKRIDTKIEYTKAVIEYLEEVVNICKFTLPKSCENIIKLKDLEART